MSKIDMEIKKVHKQNFDKFQNSRLILDITGKSVRKSIVNALRRVSLLYVPSYAFCRESIYIDKNTSIFDNDYMRMRLSQITIPNIDVPVNFLEDRYWQEVDYGDPAREKDPNDKLKVEMYVNVTNTGTDTLNVTTEHANIYIDGEKINKPFKYEPILIIQLRTGQSFSCRCVGVLGVGKRSDIWSASANSYFEKLEKRKYKFIIESQGQLSEEEILKRSCDIMIKRLENFKRLIKEQYTKEKDVNGNMLYIKFENEDDTLGRLLNEILQENNDVSYSAYSRPDLLKDEGLIKLVTMKKNPLDVFLDSFEYADSLFNFIKKKI